jgi:hypothetical protein
MPGKVSLFLLRRRLPVNDAPFPWMARPHAYAPPKGAGRRPRGGGDSRRTGGNPRLLHLRVLDDDGTICSSLAPWIDGTLQGPDALFMLLAYYLVACGICAARQVLFIADGAPWIRNRIPALIEKVGSDTAKVWQIVDFHHAVEHLNAVAALRKGWNVKRRRQWVSRQRNYLWTGKNESVVEAAGEITRGRSSKLINRERSYFENNPIGMQYRQARDSNLPIGSGPMESAIRRVINLRMKGNGIFRLEDNAEAMSMLRSFYKAGRWNDPFHLATAPVVYLKASK